MCSLLCSHWPSADSHHVLHFVARRNSNWTHYGTSLSNRTLLGFCYILWALYCVSSRIAAHLHPFNEFYKPLHAVVPLSGFSKSTSNWQPTSARFVCQTTLVRIAASINKLSVVWMCLSLSMSVCVPACACLYICICISSRAWICVCICICVYVCVHMQMRNCSSHNVDEI